MPTLTPPKPVRLAPADLIKYDPHLRPEWRYLRVLDLVDRYPQAARCSVRDDLYVRGLRQYVLRWRRRDEDGKKALYHEDPALAYAYQIYERAGTDPNTQFQLEARILAQQPFEEIAEACHVLPQTVDWYEACYFNVLPRIRCHDWVLRQVLVPPVGRGDVGRMAKQRRTGGAFEPIVAPWIDWTCKFFAYFGGPIVLEYVLSGGLRGKQINTQEAAADFVNFVHQRTIQRRSAQASLLFEVNQLNVLQLFEMHTRIIEAARAAEQDGNNLAEIEININSMLTQFTWPVGIEGKRLYADTPVGRYDEGAAELTDEELLAVAAGQDPGTLEGVATMQLPPPRRRDLKQGGGGRGESNNPG